MLVDLNFQILLLVDQLLKCSCFLIQLLNDLCLIDLLLNDDVSFFLFGLELLTGRVQIGKLAFLGFQTVAHTIKILHNF